MVPLSLFTVFLPNWDWDHDPLPHLICLSHSLSITPSFCFSCALARLFCAEAINSFALLWKSSIYCSLDCFDVHRLTFHLSLAKPGSLQVQKQIWYSGCFQASMVGKLLLPLRVASSVPIFIRMLKPPRGGPPRGVDTAFTATVASAGISWLSHLSRNLHIQFKCYFRKILEIWPQKLGWILLDFCMCIRRSAEMLQTFRAKSNWNFYRLWCNKCNRATLD